MKIGPFPVPKSNWGKLGFAFLAVIAWAAAASAARSVILVTSPSAYNPGLASTWANIAAGLSMPVLAALTAWYALQTRQLADLQDRQLEQGMRRKEAEIGGFLRDLWREIQLHPSEMPENAAEAIDGDKSFTKEIFENNSESLERLPKQERRQIETYYEILYLIEDFKGGDLHPEGFRGLETLYQGHREDVIRVVAPIDELPNDKDVF